MAGIGLANWTDPFTDETPAKLKTQENDLADSRAAFSYGMCAFDISGVDLAKIDVHRGADKPCLNEGGNFVQYPPLFTHVGGLKE